MKRLLLFTVLLCSPAFAEELPIRWLEAGKETELFFFHPPKADWSLRFEHRILDQGRFADASRILVTGGRAFKIKAPPLRPGITLKAKLFFGDTPRYDIVIASPDPFEDRKEWFDKHPIALYDPDKTTIDIFEEREIPFQHLRSFADIINVKNAVVVVGQNIDFEREKDLSDLLFHKATAGSAVLVASPQGDIPLYYYPLAARRYHSPTPSIHSLTLSAEAKELFPLASGRLNSTKWNMYTKDNHPFLVSKPGTGAGATILDIRFIDMNLPQRFIEPWEESEYSEPFGRIVFDKNLRFNTVESWWYFKSLIEILTNE